MKIEMSSTFRFLFDRLINEYGRLVLKAKIKSSRILIGNVHAIKQRRFDACIGV